MCVSAILLVGITLGPSYDGGELESVECKRKCNEFVGASKKGSFLATQNISIHSVIHIEPKIYMFGMLHGRKGDRASVNRKSHFCTLKL